MALNLRPFDETNISARSFEDAPELNLRPANNELSLTTFEPKLNIRPLEFTGQENAFEKMSKFGKVLDILGRPGYAIKSYIRSGQERTKGIYRKLGYSVDTIEETDNLPEKAHQEFMVEFEKMGLGQEIKEAGQALWRGFSGQERNTMNAIFKDAGVEGIPFLGFASELAVDPLMWFGGAGYKGITKGVSAVVKPGLKATDIALRSGLKTLEKIPKVGKVVTAAKEIAPNVIGSLKKLFVTKSGIGKLGELIDTHLGRREYLKGKEFKYGVKVRNVLQNISKKTGRSLDDVERQVVTLIEQPNIQLKAASTESKVLANTLRSHFENILTKEMKAGVPITHLAQGNRNIQYFPRITTKEASKYLREARKNYKGDSKVWNTMIGNAKKRKTGDWSLQEFNDFVASHGLESLGGKTVEQFFMQSPAYAVAARGMRSVKAITSAQFLDDVGKNFGLKAAPSWWQELPETVTKLNPSLRGLKFDPEVMGEVTKATGKYMNPEEIRLFGRMFDAVQNTWKKWTLAPFPKYHIRNMVGNTWNNYLAGVKAEAYPKAQALQMYRKFKNKSGKINNMMKKNSITELKALGLTPQNADDIIRKAEETGVLGHGWYAADIETGIEKALKGEGGIIGRGMAFGTTIENNARLAHFVDKIDNGMNIQSAARSVKKYLFDYKDLTHFEKTTMKRIFPFYTWTRKNIPLQLEQLYQQPQKFSPLAISLRNRDPQDLLRLKYARPDLYDRLPVELRRDADTVTYVPLEGLIPAGDLTKMMRPQELLVEMLTPYLKAPIELGINKSFYFEREIQRYPNETQEFLRMDIPVKLKYIITTVLPQARLLNEMNKLVRKQVRKEELTLGEQAFSQALSSVYKTNLKDLRDRALQNVERKVKELKSGAFWAKRYKRENEFKRIMETYKEMKALMKKIKGR